MEPSKIRYAAGLTNYVIAKDLVTGHKTPRLRDNSGQVHAVYNDTRRPAMKEPFFVEETWDYRAALCGELIRVIMPLSFKSTEENVCQRCVAKMETTDITQPSQFDGTTLEGIDRNWWLRQAPSPTPKRPTLPNTSSKNT